MAYVALASAKASPGVTTAVVALAAAWPRHRSLHVVEIDPAGGDMAARLGLPPEPGLVTLAAVGGRDVTGTSLAGHTQPLPGERTGRPVRRALLAPVAADDAVAALATVRGRLPEALSELGTDVLVDCGRLGSGSLARDVAAAADLLVVVTRPIVADVQHVIALLATFKPRATSLLLVGDRPYPLTEVAAAVGTAPLGALPIDEWAARALSVGSVATSSALRRSRLLRDAQGVAERLASWLGPGSAQEPATTADRPAVAPSPANEPPRPAGPPPARMSTVRQPTRGDREPVSDGKDDDFREFWERPQQDDDFQEFWELWEHVDSEERTLAADRVVGGLRGG
jgi:MinD-like ATPase involved in chromosome partitioning or flagellar assembly